MKQLIILMMVLLVIPLASATETIITDIIADNSVKVDPLIDTTQQSVFQFGEAQTSRGTAGNFGRAYFDMNLTNASIEIGTDLIDLVHFQGVRGGNPDVGYLPIFEVNETWGLSTLTWDNQPCGTLTPLLSNLTTCNFNPESNITFDTPFQNFTYNVTEMFRRALSEGRGRLSFALISPENNDGAKVNIASKDEADETKHWFLNVTHSPDPTPPDISLAISDTNPEEGDIIQITPTCTDTLGLTNLTLENDAQGSFQEVLFVNLTGLSGSSIFDHTVVEGSEVIVTHRATCGNTRGNTATSSATYTTRLILPLSSAVTVVGMVVLFLIIFSAIFSRGVFKRAK